MMSEEPTGIGPARIVLEKSWIAIADIPTVLALISAVAGSVISPSRWLRAAAHSPSLW